MDWERPIGYGGGLLGGLGISWLARTGLLRQADRARRGVVDTANAMLPPVNPNTGVAATVNRRSSGGRAANLNAFYAQGGGPEPLRVSGGAAGGFTEVPGVDRSVAGLYQPGSAYARPLDIMPPLAMGATSSLSFLNYDRAARELEDARKNNDGSRQAQERVANAEADMALARIFNRTVATAPLTYGTQLGRRYDVSRPDVQRAQQELDALLAFRQRELARRRR
jgi:hypothetical protein